MDADEMIRHFCKSAALLAEENNIPELEKVLKVFPTVFSCHVSAEEEGGPTKASVVHICCTSKRMTPQTLKFILDNGGKNVINTPTSQDQTPIFRVKYWGVIRYDNDALTRDRRQEVIDLLKQYGGDDSLSALQNTTDLHFAVMREALGTAWERDELQAQLRNHPEAVFMRDAYGNTPLDYIMEKRKPHCSVTRNGLTVQEIFRMFLEPDFRLSHPVHGHWLANQKWIYLELTKDDFLNELFHFDRWKGHEEAMLALRDDMTQYFRTATLKSEWPELADGYSGEFREGFEAGLQTSYQKINAIDFTPIHRIVEARTNAVRGGKFEQALKKPQKPPSMERK